ncbi:MAG: ABC transporter permease [Nanoarchaeota archaeon]|nr:ABC transporter permease [Nanoarchaeota archaeon]
MIVWELLDYIFQVKEIIIPNPHEIFYAIINNFSLLLNDTYITMLESVLGFIIGSGLGILIALLFTYSTTSKKALYPYAIALKATPLYALAPVLIIWFGNGIMSKIVMSGMVAFFPVLVNAIKGFTSIEPENIELFRSLSASKWQIFVKLRLPNALPYIFPALKIATTLAVVGATIAEFTGASQGIGHLIVNSSYYLETSLMFAGIIMISLAGILFFYLIDFLEKKLVFWQINE